LLHYIIIQTINFQGRLAINTTDKATTDACSSVFQSGIRQLQYRLKQTYFTGRSIDQIPTTSPHPSISDEQWAALVANWSSPKNLECAALTQNLTSPVGDTI